MSQKSHSPLASNDMDLRRWKSLPHDEKVAEFNALIECPYWYFLPDDLKARIRELVFH